MLKDDLYKQKLIEYSKNIKLKIFFNDNGIGINELMKEIILNNCSTIKRKKLEI